jgi:Skp family chaperone for outer membrane proteins
VELIYRPALLAQAVVRYVSTKAGVNADRHFAFVVTDPQPDMAPHWGECTTPGYDSASLARTPPPGGKQSPDLPPGLADPKKLAAWQKDLVNYLYRTADFGLHQNPALKLFSRPGQSYEEFRAQCQRAANAKRDEELEKIRARYDKKIDALEAKRAAEARELNQNERELQARESESRWTGIENLLGIAIGRSPYRMFSTSEQKKRLAQKAKHEVSESQETITELEAQIAALKAEAQPLFQTVADKWAATAQDIHELRVTPKRSDILIELFGVGWLAHWQIEADGQMIEIKAMG